MGNELALNNDKICQENYRYCADNFPAPRSSIGDYVIEAVKLVSINNPVSVVANTLDTALKSFVFLRNRKYQLTAIKYMTDVEDRKIQAFVGINRLKQEERLVTLAIDRDYQRSIRVIENKKLVAMAEIDAQLKTELKKCDLREREIIRQTVLCNALFSQNVKRINEDRETKAAIIKVFSEVMASMPREFIRRNGRDWGNSDEKQIADDFFQKIITLTDNHYDYIDIRQFINAMR